MIDHIPDIRISELLDLWSELDDALRGANHFGGDTAELYAYRFDFLSPLRHSRLANPERVEAHEAQAATDNAQRLYELLKLFKSHRGCHIEVDGRVLGTWLRQTRFGYGHRVHVKVRA